MSPTTWPEPDEILTVEDPQLGCVKLLVWRGWHFKKTGAHAFIVLWLEHPHTHGMHRAPKDLWVAWIGGAPRLLAAWWRMYLRRFAVNHWYRFVKGSFHWTLPHAKTPEQAERWSDLVPFLI